MQCRVYLIAVALISLSLVGCNDSKVIRLEDLAPEEQIMGYLSFVAQTKEDIPDSLVSVLADSIKSVLPFEDSEVRKSSAVAGFYFISLYVYMLKDQYNGYLNWVQTGTLEASTSPTSQYLLEECKRYDKHNIIPPARHFNSMLDNYAFPVNNKAKHLSKEDRETLFASFMPYIYSTTERTFRRQLSFYTHVFPDYPQLLSPEMVSVMNDYVENGLWRPCETTPTKEAN